MSSLSSSLISSYNNNNRNVKLESLGPQETTNRNLRLHDNINHDNPRKEVKKNSPMKSIHPLPPHNLSPIHRRQIQSKTQTTTISPSSKHLSNISSINKDEIFTQNSTPPEPQDAMIISNYNSNLSSSSSSNGLSVLLVTEKLRVRLKEVEIENERLRKRLQLVDESMKSMRASFTTTPNGTIIDGVKRDVSTQTKKDSNGSSNSSSNRGEENRDVLLLRKSIENIEEKLIASLGERDNLLKNLSDVSREFTALQTEHKCSKEQYVANEQIYQDKIQSLEQLVQELSDSSISLSQKRKSVTENMKLSQPITMKKLIEINQQFQILKKEFKKLKAISDIHANINADKQQHSSLQLLQSKIELLHQQYSNQINNIRKSSDYYEKERDSIRQLFDKEVLKSKGIENELTSLHTSLAMEKDSHKICKDKLVSLLTLIQSDSDRYQEIQLKLKEKDKDIMLLKSEIKNAYGISEQRAVKIQTAKQQVFDIHEKYKLEIQAIRHDAHIKDLTRIANIREVTLERDKVILELQTAREVTNILSFALKTAEQSLAETNPDLVNKLVEGRNKRLKELERVSNDRAKDIDQRSAETNAVSSTHLEVFKEKAALKLKICQDESKKYLDVLKNTLSIDDITTTHSSD